MNGLFTRPRLITLSVAVALAIAVLVVSARFHRYTDVEVYRMGGQAWWLGLPLYVEGWDRPMGGVGLAFTYPPLAAALFAILYALGSTASMVVITLLGAAALGTTVLSVLAASGRRLPSLLARTARPLAVTLSTVVLLCLFEPVRMTVNFGQVNLILMGMVAADLLLPRTRWPRGLLIGLAAAVKLTPIMFLLFFLVKGRWRPAVTVMSTFVGSVVLGWLLAPRDSSAYWLGVLGDPTRIGVVGHESNQSWRGVLARLGVTTGPTWLIPAVLTLVFVVLAVRRLPDPPAVFAIAAGTLLVSPISWSHHWVWAVPVAVWLGARGFWWAAGATAAVFVIGPHWQVGSPEQGPWTWQHLIGNGYVLLACGFLARSAVGSAWSGGDSRSVMSRVSAPSSGRAEEATNPREA